MIISLLVTLVAITAAPELDDPPESQRDQLRSAVFTIQEGDRKLIAMRRAELEQLGKMQPVSKWDQPQELDLPRVTGHMLSDGMADLLALVAPKGGASSEDDPWSPQNMPYYLSGLIQSQDGRAAIVSDGSNDYVVGKGSYLPGRLRVIDLLADRLVVATEPKAGQSRKIEIRMLTP